jgi:hypothetical protein
LYLYELALELDAKSLELAERARAAGVDGAGPNTLLTAVQVQALRSGVPVPPPPPSTPDGAPSFVPPPPPPTPAPTDTHGKPISWGAGAPPAEDGDAAPAGPPTATADGAPGAAPTGAPVPPGPSSLPPPPGVGGVPFPDGTPGGAGRAAGLRAMPLGQKLVIGGLVAGVVALFGYMVTTNAPRGAVAAPRSATTEPGTPTTIVRLPSASMGITDPKGFCTAMRVLFDTWPDDDVELRNAPDLPAVQALLMRRQGGWSMAMVGLRGVTTGSVAQDVELVNEGYERRRDVLLAAQDEDQLEAAVKGASSIYRGGEIAAGERLSAHIADLC